MTFGWRKVGSRGEAALGQKGKLTVEALKLAPLYAMLAHDRGSYATGQIVSAMGGERGLGPDPPDLRPAAGRGRARRAGGGRSLQ